MTTKPICWIPYNGVEIHPHGYVGPCCKISFNDNTSPYKFDLSKFYSEEAKAWRTEKFEQGKLQDLCKQCDVPKNVFSYRKLNEDTYRSYWKFPEPTSENAAIRKLILGTDNICASSCISCGPKLSTTINNLLEKADDKEIIKKFYTASLPGLVQFDLNQLDNNISDLEVIHFFGGEPLFSPNFIKLLEKLKIHAPKLHAVTMSTGLCKIKESHVAYLADMPVKTNRVTISIDGPLELNHWIRDVGPKEFERSFDLLVAKKDKITLTGFQTTLGIYNVFALPELVELFLKTLTPETTNERSPVMVSALITSPFELHPRQLPEDVKKRTIEKLENFLKSGNCPHHCSEIINTAIFAMQQPATLPWDRCLERMELHPRLRGRSETFDYWINKYL